MSFGLTTEGFKIKRLADIKEEIETSFKNSFGENIDLSEESPFGQLIGIFAERESLVWELAQDVYNSQYPVTAEGNQLDNVVSLTGTVRNGPQFSRITDGVARGTNGTVVPAGTIISIPGNTTSKFITQEDATINIVDGGTFKSANILLVAQNSGPVQALAGTLTNIETPVSGMDSFTNESDAQLGSNSETDSELKARRDQELQIAGSATIEAIVSELSQRELVTAVIVFQNNSAVTDSEGRPAHHLDIVVEGDNDADVAQAIFEVIGAGIGMVGDVTETVIDSQGFNQEIKFSRPTDISIWLEVDVVTNPALYPADGDTQVRSVMLAHGDALGIGEDVVVYGSNALICAINDIPGITDLVIRIGKTASPTTDDNIVIEPREKADFDSSRIAVASS